MPYFPNDRVDRVVGDFRIWNWARNRDRAEQADRDYLDQYFGLFVRNDNRPEERLAILSESNGNPFPEEDSFRKSELRRLATALMACYLFRLPRDGDQGWAACSSDNFVAFHQQFEPTGRGDGVAFDYGSYIRVRVMGNWDHIRFTTPQHVPEPMGSAVNEELLDVLGGLVRDDRPAIERIFRALDWLQPAFAKFDISYQGRIVAMCTAFEILLDFPDFGKAQHFSQRLNQLIPRHRLTTSTRMWQNRNITDNDVGWWCRSFYDLRSRIVHGEPIPPADFYHTPGREHLRIALFLLEECVRGSFVEEGRISEDDRMADFAFHHPWVEELGLSIDAWR